MTKNKFYNPQSQKFGNLRHCSVSPKENNKIYQGQGTRILESQRGGCVFKGISNCHNVINYTSIHTLQSLNKYIYYKGINI